MKRLEWSDLTRRRRMVRVYRGQFVSAYMKAVRLRRPEDAMYWLGVLWIGNAGADYLRRRVFCSAAEDNLDVWVMEHTERLLSAKRGSLVELQYAAYLSCLGTKWYELPDGVAYTRARCAAGLAPHPLPRMGTNADILARYERAVAVRAIGEAYWCIAEARARQKAGRDFAMWPFYVIAAEAGVNAPDEVTVRSARIIHRQLKWLGASREKNHLWQLLWALGYGPLRSALRPLRAAEFNAMRARVDRRLAQRLEPVPGWALDGIHTGGHDPRFAGSWQGLINMIGMYERDGTLEPTRPGNTLQAGIPPGTGGYRGFLAYR
jgi:hypothetical protein